MKNFVAKINYWTAVEACLWGMAGLWFFLTVVGFMGLHREATICCADWFVRMLAAAVVIRLARVGIY